MSYPVQIAPTHIPRQLSARLDNLTSDLVYDIAQRSQNTSGLLLASKKISDLLAISLKKAEVRVQLDTAHSTDTNLNLVVPLKSKRPEALNPKRYPNIEQLRFLAEAQLQHFCSFDFFPYYNLRVLSFTDLYSENLLQTLIPIKHLQELYISNTASEVKYNGWQGFLNTSWELKKLHLVRVDFAENLVLNNKALIKCSSLHLERGIHSQQNLAIMLRAAKNLQQLLIINCSQFNGHALAYTSTSQLTKLNISQVSANSRIYINDLAHMLWLNQGIERLRLKHFYMQFRLGASFDSCKYKFMSTTLSRLQSLKFESTDIYKLVPFFGLKNNISELQLSYISEKDYGKYKTFSFPRLENFSAVNNDFCSALTSDILKASPNLSKVTIEGAIFPVICWNELNFSQLRTLRIVFSTNFESNPQPEANFTKHDIGIIARKAQNLKYLKIASNHLSGSLGSLEGSLRDLEELDLEIENLTNLEIREITKRSQNLEVVTLTRIKAISNSALTQIAIECSKLKHLGVHSCKYVTRQGIKDAIEYTKKYSHI